MKRLVSRTLFFLAIVLVVGGITAVFGEVNSLVGVAIVVIGLMMLQRDLSVRPVWNTCVMMLFTCMLGLGAFVALINPFLGLAVNVAIVLITVFATVQDLNSPLHFPFILGYAFMLSVPVTWEELPFRILALIAGSIATVVLNIIMNRKRMARTSHNAVVSICEDISRGASMVLNGEKPSVAKLEQLCSRLNMSLYDRLHDRFFASARDSTVVELVSSLMCLGRATFEKERDPEVLKDVIGLMEAIEAHENGEKSLDEVKMAASQFVDTREKADFAILSSIRTIISELEKLNDEGPVQKQSFVMPSRETLKRLVKENFRRDSVRFTFGVRMAMMFSLWAFVWQYWDLENAKWLLYTTAALVQPYIEGTWAKSGMRIAGTLLGAFGYVAIALITNHDLMLMSAALMVVSYIYTLVDPKRYDVMMTFITLTALLAAALADPRGDVLLERLLFILSGVVAAIMANMMILPYRLKDETIELGRRSVKVTSKQIEAIRRTADGIIDDDADSYLVLKANNISLKMQMNDSREESRPFSGFISAQNALTSECAMLQKSLETAGSLCRSKVAAILDTKEEKVTREDCEGLNREESEILMRTANVMTMYRENRMRLADASLGLPE